ncbi:hypothetical protein [Streptomyces sp. NPDC052036]|uniref:hypothetical protein n=1 Tax=Streptomyces sp. NPDC052036 TaxID=3155171 RepID=UPI00342C33EC
MEGAAGLTDPDGYAWRRLHNRWHTVLEGGLQPAAIGDVVTRAGERAGIEIRFTGHSPRRGLATSSRLKGHDQIVIAKQDGWAPHSKVLAGYQRVLQQQVAAQEPGVWATSVAEVPPLVGLQEATQLFGLTSQQNLSAVVRQGRCAPADYQLSGSPLWLLDTLIEAAPDIRAKSRTVMWAIAPQVEAALRQGRYTGPGSVIVPRGRAAKAL